jgi:hypothetical protein
MRIVSRSLVCATAAILFIGAMAVGAETSTPLGDEPVAVSGTLTCPAGEAATGTVASDESVTVHHWTASDPRLEGEAVYSGHWRLYEPPAEDSGVPAAQDAAVYSIVNEGGSWLCQQTRTPEQPRSPGDRQTLIFTGQGDYAGLTAYLEVDLSEAPYAFSGLILPGDAPPWAEPQG